MCLNMAMEPILHLSIPVSRFRSIRTSEYSCRIPFKLRKSSTNLSQLMAIKISKKKQTMYSVFLKKIVTREGNATLSLGHDTVTDRDGMSPARTRQGKDVKCQHFIGGPALTSMVTWQPDFSSFFYDSIGNDLHRLIYNQNLQKSHAKGL